MAVIILCSVSGAPGVTTLATALAATSQQRTLIVEADTSTTSRIIPGVLGGSIPHETGMADLMIGDHYGRLTEQALWEHSIGVTDTIALIPGFTTLASAHDAGDRFWDNLTLPLRAVAARGITIIIDAGRITAGDPRTPLLRFADSTTLLIQNTLPAFASAHTLTHPSTPTTPAGWLREQMAQVGHEEYLDVIVVRHPASTAVADLSAHTFPSAEIASGLGLNLAGTLPWDVKGSAPFTFTVPNKPRPSAYLRAVSAAGYALEKAATDRTATTREEIR